MRLAVLGVGLIGGSVGLAARQRLDAEVTGFDSDPQNAARALELGALDRAAGSVPEAVEGAGIVFCAAPIGALPALVTGALEASADDVIVTDVGSTKEALLAGLEGEGASRFIGGHPLAGAETAGVENARADLFEGARWYLTPTERSSGLHYDRLQRAIADLGARPQAIDAEAHDRLMAAVSHVPHVIANVLVREAAAAVDEESERLFEVGPSFRDTTRVAGANPAIWGDIFATNSEAVAREVDAVSERLREAADLIRSADPREVADWHRAALRDRRRLLEADLAGGELREVRVAVENRPGTVAEIALALGRARVNIEDMTLYPAPDMRTGAVTLWVAGESEADRAAGIVRELGYSVSVSE
jgi:prephenate dehydrogenase